MESWSNLPRVVLVAIGLCIAPVAVSFLIFIFQHRSSQCERKLLSQTVSPDGQWRAILSEEICADGMFITTATNVVQVVRSGDTAMEKNDIFSIEAGSSNYPEPRVLWPSSNNIKIVIPSALRSVFLKKTMRKFMST